MEKEATLIERAIKEVPGFAQINQKLERRVRLNSLSRSTFDNYSRSLAKISLYFKRTPLQLSLEEIEDYLLLQKRSWQPSESFFKHMVYGLRFLFRMYDREADALKLPVVQRSKKLPVILSKEECRALFSAPRSLKHRVLLSLIYSAGLRMCEVKKQNLCNRCQTSGRRNGNDLYPTHLGADHDAASTSPLHCSCRRNDF